jgi:hypothetical protein
MISISVDSDVCTEIGTLISSALEIEPNIIRNDRAKAITREILRFMIYLLVRYTQVCSSEDTVENAMSPIRTENTSKLWNRLLPA